MLYTIGDEIHLLEEKNGMYFIKRYTITNIIHNKYYELFDGEKKDSVSIYSNNIFKNCDNAFNERDKRIKNKQKLDERNKITHPKIKEDKIRKQQKTINSFSNNISSNKTTLTQIGTSTLKNHYSKKEIKELALRIQKRILEKRFKSTNKNKQNKTTTTQHYSLGLKNPKEKRIIEYKPPKRRYNPRYDGDVKIRPLNEGIGERIRVIKNSSGVVIGVEKY